MCFTAVAIANRQSDLLRRAAYATGICRASMKLVARPLHQVVLAPWVVRATCPFCILLRFLASDKRRRPSSRPCQRSRRCSGCHSGFGMGPALKRNSQSLTRFSRLRSLGLWRIYGHWEYVAQLLPVGLRVRTKPLSVPYERLSQGLRHALRQLREMVTLKHADVDVQYQGSVTQILSSRSCAGLSGAVGCAYLVAGTCAVCSCGTVWSIAMLPHLRRSAVRLVPSGERRVH